MWGRIVVERAHGERWRDIARRANLSERQCRRIYRQHQRSTPELDPSHLQREIAEAIAGYDADISELALISATARSDWTRVQAIRSRVNARARKVELLSISGALADARAELDVRAVVNAVMQTFDEHGVPDDARRAVLAALRGEAKLITRDRDRVREHQLSAVRTSDAVPACARR